LGAFPVFDGKGVKREDFHAEVSGRKRGGTNGLDSPAVPFKAGQTAGFGPAAVAVHDDGDMRGDSAQNSGRSDGFGPAKKVKVARRAEV